uniref:Uncharacterized protein n=1 Tax=Proboscia inermis TaxID=420281 RepID=A0A7S0GA74_9STRA|mmetsp:Transcript_11254/g.11351  ORF Transcript_11254/g.11351 Transcript_11254/m.11351 type:complete len:116 (+) Transcript_11254:188-535(+)|eukprot:CAMPEP_0171320386 /NCGR_PEP_ID=MMETSP0816-20121228/103867_1 /TAXON_ID=420281 /ORGANISM="Proboscia inermis, Strain CCAP1064/1" /LENGTH=115 /DNA_ID=CAMNT_0011817141 /DNA_START=172 /DNA_END=519 /DNA_ORIENTATION=-
MSPQTPLACGQKIVVLDKGTMFRVIHAVSEKNEMVVCNRRSPLVFGPQSIPGPDDEVVDILQVELGQEPIDAIYAFFAMNDLFEKKWDLLSILDQICILPALRGAVQTPESLKIL